MCTRSLSPTDKMQRYTRIRRAEPADAEALLELIRELAAYQGKEQIRASAQDLSRALSNRWRPYFFALIAELEAQGHPAGFALVYPGFSTWEGHVTLRLEDLYVRTEYRGNGIGISLMTEVIEEARRFGAARIDWQMLASNAAAIGFYERLGAKLQPEWTMMSLLCGVGGE